MANITNVIAMLVHYMQYIHVLWEKCLNIVFDTGHLKSTTAKLYIKTRMVIHEL